MDPSSENKPITQKEKEENQFSTSELMSSAKVVSEAIQASLRNETGKVDKARAADAAGDLLAAASHYGKLDQEKGVGQYVEKAENYLHGYKTSQPSTTTTTDTSSGDSAKTHSTDPPKDAPAQSKSEGDGGSEGGVGGYLKMAQGFLGQK